METSLFNTVNNAFVAEFNKVPVMIFSPGRINFIGEHTDYNNGFVLPAAIDKGITMAISKSENSLSRVVALDLDESMELSTADTFEKTNSWHDYFMGILQELDSKAHVLSPFEVVFSGNLDVGSGMSSSAALENAFIFGLNEVFDLGLSKKEMIHISQAAEHNFVGVKCGIMDQFASMFGETNSVIKLDCQSLEAKPYEIDLDSAQILIINTNVKHKLSDSAYNNRRDTCEKVAKMAGVESLREVSDKMLQVLIPQLEPKDFEKASYVLEENQRVLAFCKAIETGDLHNMGKLLYQSHYGLQHQYEVSCKELDFLVEYGKSNAKVYGSRMMGGGFGGCIITLIDKSILETYITEISKAYFNEFNRSCTTINVKLSHGTKRLK